MTVSAQMIDELKANISRLMEKIQAEKTAGEKLLEEVKKLRSIIEEKETAYNELASRYQTLLVAKTVASKSNSSSEAKATIHNLVREIDKCIALLNR